MKSLFLTTTVVLTLLGTPAQSAEPTAASHPNNQSFELAPNAPAQPALKYQFMYDDLGDRLPGNAAILYLDSVLLLGPSREAIDRADEAYAIDKEQFATLADSLELPSVMKELELAGRRTECDWQPPYREQGADTLLPHLEPMTRGIARLLWLRALRQTDEGNLDEAIKTIRLGYEMSDKMGREGILVSGLCALSVDSLMDDAVIHLMNHPNSPNLYWALSELPSRRTVFRRSLDGERQWALTSIPDLARVKAGEQLSGADEWRAIFANVERIINLGNDGEKFHVPDPVKGASAETLKRARDNYAAAHKLTAAQAAEVEPISVLGEYYYRQFEIAYDAWYKLRGLPYPALLVKAKEFDAWAKKQKSEQPSNILVQTSPDMSMVVSKFAQYDRRLAALIAVEALRSYAAANNGKLPEHLEDVTETPIPPNPMTGLPFQYSATNGAAKISDSTSESPLEFTVTVRK